MELGNYSKQVACAGGGLVDYGEWERRAHEDEERLPIEDEAVDEPVAEGGVGLAGAVRGRAKMPEDFPSGAKVSHGGIVAISWEEG